MRNAALARLDRARGDVEKTGYGEEDSEGDSEGEAADSEGEEEVELEEEEEEVEEEVDSPAPALSRPAITTTVEPPTSGDTDPSIGCTCASLTPSARATCAASAW